MKIKALFSALVLLTVLTTSGYSQTWRYTGSMDQERWISGCIALDDQTAMVMGGYDRFFMPIASCEIFDPATETWAYTGAMNVARALPLPVKLADGKVLIFGGLTGSNGSAQVTDVVEMYDPATNSWTTVGQMLKSRLLPTVTLLSNGTVFIAGGLTNDNNGTHTTNECEIYDPSTNTSVAAASMASNRYEHKAVLLNDGTVLLTGGRDGGAYSNYFDLCEIYDPSTDTWANASTMSQRRMQGILTKFADGVVLASGGRNTPTSSAPGSEIFDPSSGTWNSTDPMQEPVAFGASVMFPGDRFMVTGGIIDGSWVNHVGIDNASTAACEWYDKEDRSWYFAPTLNDSRDKHSAIYLHQTVNPELPEDLIVVAGGHGGMLSQDTTFIDNQYLNSAEVLDITDEAIRKYKQNPQSSVSPGSQAAQIRILQTAIGVLLHIPVAQSTTIKVDLLTVDGKFVQTVNDLSVDAGIFKQKIDAFGLASGVYLVRITVGSSVTIHKILL
jgi:hypothetical protein